MCLEVCAKLSPHAKIGIGADRLAAASGMYVVKHQNDLGSCLHFSASGGCSCDLLAKGPLQEGETWVLTQQACESLSQATAAIGKEAKSFLFRASWLGDEQQPDQRIKPAELLKLIRTNQLGKNITYVVGSHG